MERWQSRHEHRVEHNLSDSGVRPYTLEELTALLGVDLSGSSLGYTQTDGSEILRRRISALYPGASAENALVTTGGAEANFLALWELVTPGDRVVVVVPTYGQTPGLARGLGAEVVEVPLEEERGWGPAPGALVDAAAGGARLIVVTNPNNPTGAVLSPEAREEVVAAAELTGAWILSDEVYAGAEREGEETESLWRSHDRVLVTGSLSKAYGLPGLRLGWLVGPAEEMGRFWARKDYTTIAPGALSDRLAAGVLEPPTRLRVLERTRGIIGRNLALLEEWLAGRPDEFAYRPPDAGAICWVRCRRDVGSSELAERLRAEESVLVVPGDHFGMDGYLRIGFGGDPAELGEALAGVGRFMERL